MPAKPKFSVITVCFNCASMIERTLKSVADQTDADFEYIVVDGGSTDGTLDIIKRHSNTISNLVSEPDRGIYDAMNKGVKLASGDLVIFMNAGDTFASSDTLSKISASAEPDATVIYGDVIKTDSSGNEFIKKAEKPHNSHRMFFCHQSSLTSRKALLKHQFDLVHPYSADFKLIKQLYRQGAKFQQLEFPIARFDSSGVSNTKRSTALADNLKVLRETDTFFSLIKLSPRLIIPLIISKLRGK